MLMSLVRMLLRLFMISLLMMICRRVVCFGCVFVVLGCLAVCFVCHKSPFDLGRVPGRNPYSCHERLGYRHG
jgi:hypothetical protein